MPDQNTTTPQAPSGAPSPFPPPRGQQGQQPQQGQPVQPPAAAPYVQQPQQSPPGTFQQAAMDAIYKLAARTPPSQRPTTPPRKLPRYSFNFADDYFLSGTFDQDIADMRSFANRRTGFANYDSEQPFYPGLYVLGALAGLGKTSFSVQLADQLAASGVYVLYLSLEQGRLDFFSKCIARSFFLEHLADAEANAAAQGQGHAPSVLGHRYYSKYPTPTAMDIRTGLVLDAHPDKLAKHVDKFVSDVQSRVCVVQGQFEVTVEDIRWAAELFVQQMGVRPVIIIDYLQIMAPTLVNKRVPDAKTAVDHIVHTLKAMQLDLGLTVLLISSLNRQNYLAPIDFESFKESGGIEFTADVMLGLQLAVMNTREFYNKINADGTEGKETSLTRKRMIVRSAKKMNPRALQLVCLKNRYGISSFELLFDYFPANEYFHPVTEPKDVVPLRFDPKGDLMMPDYTVYAPGSANGAAPAASGQASGPAPGGSDPGDFGSSDLTQDQIAMLNGILESAAENAPGGQDGPAPEGDDGHA